jgi:Cyclic nucleotide-binding domain
MRYEASVTSLSWIPSEAIGGAMRLPFDAGFTHYDEPPPDSIEDLEGLRVADRFRFANLLRAWIDVDDDGRITDFGYSGGGLMGSTTVNVGPGGHTFPAIALPDIQREPVVADDGKSVRFVQTAGGRTGLPAPRRVRRRPFVQWRAPLVWSTLALTIAVDGSSSFEVVGAARFPRHWIYGNDLKLAAKTGMTDFKEWYRRAFGKHSPWGDVDSPALVTAAETALERTLSDHIMRHGTKPKIKKLKEGKTLVRQGEPGTDLFVVLDGVVRSERDGERLAEYGPGAILGERAILEGGTRTSTLVAVTPCRIAVAGADDVYREHLEAVSSGHRREDDASRV